ncbi:MAG: hypothetical protein CSB55_01455 [Candidatus Cloacimonadota bacterium]|nr:MAG: hypothetical protein CSB55_01455 [Candidatus Cloacimonadota bacterium]
MKKTILIICLAFWGLLNAQTLARWETSMGNFTAELCDRQAPITADNFISLARNEFYNNLIFHRVIEGFVIQDGCPYGNGYGGPGYTIEDEFDTGLLHDRAGTLAMANTGQPNSAGSQYYITLAPQPNLDGNYAVFGYVVEGLDVVLAIGSVETGAGDKPIEDVNIYSVKVSDFYISSKLPAEDIVDTYAGDNLAFAVTPEETAPGAELTYVWYVNGTEITDPEYQNFYFAYTPSVAGTDSISCVVSDSEFDIVTSWILNVSGVSSENYISESKAKLYQNSPNPFKINDKRISDTEISFEVEREKEAVIEIYNVRGQKVKKLEKKDCRLGRNTVYWNGEDSEGNVVESGIYLYKLKVGKEVLVKKAVILK